MENELLVQYSAKYIFTLLIIVVCCQASICQTHSLNRIANQYLEEYKIPGLAISVVKPDTIYCGVAGYKKCGSSEKIDLQSKFQLASNTKAITATIAALLVEQNLIQWDTELTDVIHELKQHINPAYRDITLEQLLSNRANIQAFETDDSPEWKGIPKSIKSSKNSKLEFAKYALHLDPVVNKNKNHSYSNGGFIIAALLLERASGKTWNELIKLYNNEYGVDAFVGFPNQESSSATYGHKKKFGKFKSISAKDEYQFNFEFSAAGNLSMNIEDLSLVMTNHLDGLLGQDNILTAKTYEKLHFGFDKYALGWYNGNIGESEQKFSYHGGSLETFSSAIIISADREIAVIILVNANDKKTESLKTKLRTELWEKYGTYQSNQ